MEFEKRFWSKPDSYLSAVIFENGKRAYARIKNNLALIETLPSHTTGFHFYDVLKVDGPCGKQFYKDEEISEYKVIELYCPSDNYTFQFEAIISNSSEYFRLQEWFAKHNQIASLVFKTKYQKNEWNLCFCSAKHLAQAKTILNEFQTQATGKWYDHIIGEKKSFFQYRELKLCI
jgi:hypothetical protein